MSDQEILPLALNIDRSNLRCGFCFFLDREKIATSTGQAHEIPQTKSVYFCKRNPPRVPDQFTNIPHPIINPNRDWCGEFRHVGMVLEDANNGQESREQEQVQGQIQEQEVLTS